LPAALHLFHDFFNRAAVVGFALVLVTRTALAARLVAGLLIRRGLVGALLVGALLLACR
jgi:hypothetical protein